MSESSIELSVQFDEDASAREVFRLLAAGKSAVSRAYQAGEEMFLHEFRISMQHFYPNSIAIKKHAAINVPFLKFGSMNSCFHAHYRQSVFPLEGHIIYQRSLTRSGPGMR